MLCGAPVPGQVPSVPELTISVTSSEEAPPSGPTGPKRPKTEAGGGDWEDAKRSKVSADDAGSWSKESRVTPSGRRLRDVQGWADSGVVLSSRSDRAARLLDFAAEMVLGVFGDPYGPSARSASPRRLPHR
jgi:hypothetical protein